jgi:UDP-glucose 4-epimerase
MSTVADASLIKQELGFVPENSSLENIIKSSWE